MIDIFRLSRAELERFVAVQAEISRQEADAARVRDLRGYYYGDHPTLLTQRQQEFIGPLLTESEFPFAHNLVRSVVDTLRERLAVSGFKIGGRSMDDDNAEDVARLWEWWQANRLDEQQIRTHRRALRDGWAYAMVDYDPENMRPRITVHKRDDGTSGIMPTRSSADPNKIHFVTRYFWTDDERPGRARKTVYLPHEIQKFIRSKGGEWIRHSDPGDPGWPIPWTDRNGSPLGIPVIEFANPGGSEIAGIIPLQNALNKTWLDLLAAADSSGFPILAIEYKNDGAFTPSTDDDNLTGSDEFHFAPGRAVEVDNATVKRLDAASLAPMIETMWAITTAISGVSRTPQYYLRPIGGSDVPSGEALKQLESGLVKRAEERQLVFGYAWADIMRMCARVEDTFGQPFALGDEGIETIWDDPEVRNEQAEAQTASAHAALGVPDDAVWGILGYSPAEIKAFRAGALQQRSAEIANIAAAMRVNTNRPQSNPEQFNGNGIPADLNGG